MTLEEILKFVNTPVCKAIGVVGASLLFAYVVMHVNKSAGKQYKLAEKKEEPTEEDTYEPEYKPVQIKALDADISCEIRGEVTNLYQMGNRCSGLIKDSSGEIPFNIDPENNSGEYDSGEAGLIPIVLNDALKTKGLVELCGELNDRKTIFNVNVITYKLNRKQYKIGSESDED